MPVVKFPGVEKTIYEMTPEEIEKAFNHVVGDLPPATEEETAAWLQEMDEKFYYEDAATAITRSFILLSDYRDGKIKELGESSSEVTAVKEEIAPAMTKLRGLENNLDNPDVKKAIKSLRDIWTEYKGGYYDEKGELKWRNKPVGAEIIPALRSAINFDL